MIVSRLIGIEEVRIAGTNKWKIQDFDDDAIERISKEEILARPIVIDHNGVIIDGNHRAVKAKQLGMQRIPAYYPIKDAE